MEMEIFTGVVLLDDRQRIYLIKEDDENKIGQDRWNLPGGGIDIGEGIIESAKRETLEETGYQSKTKSILGVYQGSKVGKSWLYVVLGATISGPTQKPVKDASIKAGKWFAKDEFLGLDSSSLVHSDMKLVYRKAIGDKGLGLDSVKFVNYDSK
ncbi:NUDIX hydrolase [Patescibacteria group bacterium]